MKLAHRRDFQFFVAVNTHPHSDVVQAGLWVRYSFAHNVLRFATLGTRTIVRRVCHTLLSLTVITVMRQIQGSKATTTTNGSCSQSHPVTEYFQLPDRSFHSGFGPTVPFSRTFRMS